MVRRHTCPINACWDERQKWDDEVRPAWLACPVRVWLKRPLGDRAAIHIDSDQELLLFTPEYLNNVPQPDHGYRPANRRRRRPKRR